jgi:predicted ester cyclase
MTLPFALPQRPPVTRLRGRSTAELRAETGERTQDLPGFEPQWRDIVHYIVGITEEIWSDMAVDRIRATYAADCVIHTSMGTSRGVDGVIAGTVQSLWAFTDFTTDHLNVAWSAEGEDFYTSHLGFARSTNTGATLYGPATGRSLARHFVADCVSRDNKIHTEWLARDNATGLIQMGLQPVAVAQALAQLPAAEPLVPLGADAPIPDGDPATPAGWFARQFARWNARAFAEAADAYAPDVTAHWPGQRRADGPRGVAMLMIGLLASVPDGRLRVEHVCWADDLDGPTVAVRWRLDGMSSPYGALGTMPADRAVALIGMSHYRFEGGAIAEEWTVFDEVAVLTQAYRA